MIDRARMLWMGAVVSAACGSDPATDDDAADEMAMTEDSGSTSDGSGTAGSSTIDTGGDATAVCEAAPCGGDVVGVWTYNVVLCGEEPRPPMQCNDFGSYTDVVIEGTLELTADGSSVLHRRDGTKQRYITSKECVPDGVCAQGFPGADCVDDGTLCDCSVTTYGEWIDEVTPYAVDGDALVFDEPGGAQSISYCVAGDGLALIHPEIGEWTYLERAP